MAWLVVDLDNTLVEDGPMGSQPTDGAVEAMNVLAGEGHRLTVWTSRFAPMPDAARERMKNEIMAELASLGFPEMEVWTGTTKPAADFVIGDNCITFDQDWSLVLAQTQQMMEERGLIPPPAPGAAELAEDPNQAPEEEEVPNGDEQ